MSEIGEDICVARESAPVRTLTMKIGRRELGNLANARLYQLLDRDLCNPDPEPDPIAEAEFCIAITKAIAHKCSRIVIEIGPAEADA